MAPGNECLIWKYGAPILIPRALASLERETTMPLSLFEVITHTGLPCRRGLSTLSQDTKKESQSIKAIMCCFIDDSCSCFVRMIARLKRFVNGACYRVYNL